MKILYGPPGTGKTWHAAREAVKAIEPTRYEQATRTNNPDEALRSLHEELVNEGRILWVTFHPSYSYEDFVEGYRPVVDDSGQLAYRVVDGPFKALCLRAKFETDLQIGEQLTNSAGRLAGVVVGKDSGGWVVRVTAKRSDKVAASLDKYVPRFVVDHILSMGLPPQIFSIPGNGSHELSEYGLYPEDEDVPGPQNNDTKTTRNGSVIRKVVAARTKIFSSSDLTNCSHIGAVYRRLSSLLKNDATTGSPVALVIDEINRAEPSRVFGELITLIEIDKREGMPESKLVWLPYSKKLFSVPRNVSIIGTMNTVDRSLTALDFAMRRRFEFKHIPCEPDLVPAVYGDVAVRDLLHRINNRVGLLLGSGYEFGHAFLMAEKLELTRNSMPWSAKADCELRVVAHILRTNIIPTLAEYFHNDWGKIRAIAGESRNEGESITLFDQSLSDPIFLSRLPDEYESFDLKAAKLSNWWEPNSEEWNGNRFHRFITGLVKGE
ncbi:restriction endonuclease [Pseudomonas syringae pv. actinidifoliorum]|nr:restriction endonuclease [Pseudomonas syringae pv. actinidifoliorum]NAT36769.1 restriction endonuclease [Pseudomonas syringae pv. actinidifoliorum]